MSHLIDYCLGKKAQACHYICQQSTMHTYGAVKIISMNLITANMLCFELQTRNVFPLYNNFLFIS